MKIKLFYRTQRDLATAVNQLVDAYWDEEIAEDSLIEGIETLYRNNKEKFWKNDRFTTVVQQQCGKRRLAIVEKILHLHMKEML